MVKMALRISESETTDAQWAKPNKAFKKKWYPKYLFAGFTLSAKFKSRIDPRKPRRQMAGITIRTVN